MAKKKQTPKNPNSRHGKLSENTSQTSITMKKELLEKARAAAKSENRSLSNWLEEVVKKVIILILSALALLHWQRPPGNWSVKAIKQTVSVVVAKIEAKTK